MQIAEVVPEMLWERHLRELDGDRQDAGLVDQVQPIVPVVPAILGACYSLYVIRHFFRLAYGTVEIVIGLFAIFGAMGRAPQIVDDPATATLLLVQLAAGIYIIIRGFDNFAQSRPFAGGGAAFRALGDLIRARWARKKE